MAINRAFDIGPDLIQQALGFRELEAHDVRVAAAPEIKRGLARDRMLDDRGVRCSHRRARIIRRLESLAHVAAGVVGTVVLDIEPAQALDERLRHALERGLHAAERGIAALRRNLEGIKHGSVRRMRGIAHVRMPKGLAVAERADRLAALVAYVRYDVDIRVSRRRLAARTLVRRR